jgi:hypothetical protein
MECAIFAVKHSQIGCDRSPLAGVRAVLVPVLETLKRFRIKALRWRPDGHEPASVLAISSSLAHASARAKGRFGSEARGSAA